MAPFDGKYLDILTDGMMVIVMFALSLIIYEIIKNQEIAKTLTLKMVKDKE